MDFRKQLNKFQFMKKHIANVVTVSRIIFSFPLLFIPLSSIWFYVFYLFCGITDMIDGTIARKMGSISNFGAKLDTVADFVFMLVCSIKILPLIHLPLWLWVWIVALAFTKIFNITVVLIRKKKLLSIHSALNKITGAALFLLPLTLSWIETAYGIATVCALATVAVIQEVLLLQKEKSFYSQ